jgi:ABC-type uncharacterized transport system substrate-binding protein
VISRRTFVATVATATAAFLRAPRASGAQYAEQTPRIGILRFGPFPPSFVEPFRQELRALGYIEGQSIILEYRIAQSVAQLPDLATELIRQKVDVLVASGVQSVLPARNATSTIPVVFVAALEPVGMGLVASLGHPGGNVTGVSAIQPELTGKRLQLLKELLPKLSRVALLVPTGSPSAAQYVKDAEVAAKALGIRLQVLTVRGPDGFEEAFNAAEGAGALEPLDDSSLTAFRVQIAALALKKHLPTISGLNEIAEAGGLMAYGPNLGELYRLAARQIDKLLKGSKPANLPVELPTKFELVINLKTAKALGLTIPPSILARADRLIE